MQNENRQDFCPKLRAAKIEIEKVLTAFDIAGLIILSGGEGIAEFGLFVNTPSWSKVTFDGPFVRIKMTDKTEDEKIKANRTVNALVHLRDLSAMNYKSCSQVIDLMKKHIEITEDPAPRMHHQDNIHG